MRESILRCLESVETERLAEWETIVVVNSDEDGTVAALAERFPYVRLIVNRTNRGVGPARNQGLRLARGRIIVLLDADTIVFPGSLRGLAEALEKDAEAGVLGPKLVSRDGALQPSARRFPTIQSKLRRRALPGLSRLLPSDEVVLADGEPIDVDYVIGACQAIKREALDDVGLLDERIFYGPEDVDFCLRMWRKGWRVRWDGRWTVYHEEQRVTRRKPLSALSLRHVMALGYFFLKHRYFLRAPSRGAGVRRQDSH